MDEIADSGRPEASQESRGPFFRDDEASSGQEAVARKGRVYLDARLDDIDRCEVTGYDRGEEVVVVTRSAYGS